MKTHAAVLLILALGTTAQADVVFSFMDFSGDQNGHFLSGTVTLAGAGICDPCTSGDFVSFSLNVTGPNGFTTSGDSSNVAITPGVTANGTQLIWTESLDGPRLQFGGAGGLLLYESRPFGGAGPSPPIYRGAGVGGLSWNTVLPANTSRTIAAIPEPSAMLYPVVANSELRGNAVWTIWSPFKNQPSNRTKLLTASAFDKNQRSTHRSTPVLKSYAPDEVHAEICYRVWSKNRAAPIFPVRRSGRDDGPTSVLRLAPAAAPVQLLSPLPVHTENVIRGALSVELRV